MNSECSHLPTLLALSLLLSRSLAFSLSCSLFTYLKSYSSLSLFPVCLSPRFSLCMCVCIASSFFQCVCLPFYFYYLSVFLLFNLLCTCRMMNQSSIHVWLRTAPVSTSLMLLLCPCHWANSQKTHSSIIARAKGAGFVIMEFQWQVHDYKNNGPETPSLIPIAIC